MGNSLNLKIEKLKESDRLIFEKYLEGHTTEEETRIAETLLAAGENSSELRKLLENEWNKTEIHSSDDNERLKNILNQIHHVIRQKEFEKNNTLIRRIINVYIRAAAILVIPLLLTGVLGYIYFSEKDNSIIAGKTGNEKEIFTNTVIAPMGSRVSFILPDSTTGMLNSGSQLTYSIPFKSNRNVGLEGEAWFDVKHDESNPFMINAGNSEVKVLGTSFNISAYPTENYIEVVLYKGKVQFTENNGHSGTTIYPSERLVYQNGNISKTKTDPSKYSSWKEGKLVFRGDQMAEVGRRIERWYNVKVVLADKDLEKYSFRGTFLDDSLDEVLGFLAMTSPITYTISPRRLSKDGTFEKEIVTINLKK
jgi:hypothetical protein